MVQCRAGTIISSIPDDTRRYQNCVRYAILVLRSYKLRLPYIFGSLGIDNSIDEIGIGIQV